MHPAWSIIFFTSASGLGLGLAAWVVLGLIDLGNVINFFIVSVFTFGLIGTGLLSSTLHLGHPERAWRALSQWRSSWLSREGVLAVLVLSLLAVWFGWNYLIGSVPFLLGLPLVFLIAVTVYATSMIYASLKTVACWHHPLTPACYLLFSVSGGLLASMWLLAVAGQSFISEIYHLTYCLLILAWAAKGLWWRNLDKKSPESTLESATGLGSFGKVRPLMPPHTSENYLQTEMGFVVARRHALKLRVMSILAGGLIPLLVFISFPSSSLLLGLALVLHFVGVFIERWLFFAEAKHVVSLYYGEAQ